MIIVAAGDARIAPADRVAALTDRGALIVEADTLAGGRHRLVDFGIQTLLVEGGAVLHRSFWEADLVDRMHLIVAPHAVGDAGVPLFGGAGRALGPAGRRAESRRAGTTCGSRLMFTGIVEQMGTLAEVKPMAGGYRLRIETGLASSAAPGRQCGRRRRLPDRAGRPPDRTARRRRPGDGPGHDARSAGPRPAREPGAAAAGRRPARRALRARPRRRRRGDRRPCAPRAAATG